MGLEISKLHVRRSTWIAATPARVWEEFGSFDRLAAWFGQGHRLDRYEPSLGGRIALSVDIDGARAGFGGEIIVFDAARELSFTDNWDEEGWPLPTFITLRLTPLYEGTHVELLHHGFERLGAEGPGELAGYEEGWHNRHLETLREIVEGDASAR